MGLFDYVTVNDPRFVCSEGHDLSGEEFQSKDFGCMMGQVTIENGRTSSRQVYLGVPEADSSVVEIYATCTKCPAFVQFGTGNLAGCSVAFDVKLNGDAVESIERTSQSTSEWLAAEPARDWMHRCEGPMPYNDALELHINYGILRPEHRAEFEKWAQARAKALQNRKPWPLTLRIGEYPE